MYVVNSVLTDTSLKWAPLQSEHMELVPTVFHSFTSSPSKADTSLRWRVRAGPMRVHLRWSCLYIVVLLSKPVMSIILLYPDVY